MNYIYSDDEIAEALLLLYELGGDSEKASAELALVYAERQESLNTPIEKRTKGPAARTIRAWNRKRIDLIPSLGPRLYLSLFKMLNRLDEADSKELSKIATAVGILADKTIVLNHLGGADPSKNYFATQINNYGAQPIPPSPKVMIEDLAQILRDSSRALVAPNADDYEEGIIENE